MRIALLFLAFCGAAALADDSAFRAEAGAQYRKILAGISAKGALDDDPALLARVRRISAGLIAAAAEMRPETSTWSWEIHVTTDPSRSAFCIAGGKLLVGRAIVRDLDLTDGELAMLLGHEIAHAVADHRRAAPRSTLESDPAGELREAALAIRQEDEADRIGMRLARSAGWPPAALAGFFDKLAARESPGTFNSSHGTAAARAAAAHALARELDAAPK